MEFDLVRVQILGKDDLPSLNEVISLIRVEEGRRVVMLDTPQLKNSALISLKTPSKGPRDDRKVVDRNILWCTFCKKPRHAIDKCWRLHGKPTTKGGHLRGQGHGQAYMASNSQESEQKKSKPKDELNKVEIERL